MLSCLGLMRRKRLRTLEVKPQVQSRFNAEIQKRLAGTVWLTGGCRSWYLDRNGHNATIWPGFTFDYLRRTRRVASSDYRATI